METELLEKKIKTLEMQNTVLASEKDIAIQEKEFFRSCLKRVNDALEDIVDMNETVMKNV